MLDSNLKLQLQGYLQRISQPVEIVASVDDSDKSREMLELLQDIESVSSLVTVDPAARQCAGEAVICPASSRHRGQGPLCGRADGT